MGFKILENGNLRIERSKGQAKKMREFLTKCQDDEMFIWEFFEDELTNGFSLVAPEAIGALTEGTLISDNVINDETESLEGINIWWDTKYAIRGLGNEILEKGFVDIVKS